jgi:hypothetical protein
MIVVSGLIKLACPEDRVDRIRAELARLEWLLERQGRRNIVLRWAAFRAAPPASRRSTS